MAKFLNFDKKGPDHMVRAFGAVHCSQTELVSVMRLSMP